ncbi:MAG: hypothetical protein ABSD57_12295 [Verrucomicrobiota bacterium]|jgi:hypothetical protein
MKTLAILFLLCASVYGADTITTNVVGDITTKVLERTAKDGKPEVRIETVYRGKTKILQILSRPNKQGTLAVVSRSYFVGGDLVMIESDEDGDGVFGRISLHNPGTADLEMFKRQPDGSVKPVSTQTLEATKKQMAVVNESMRELIEKKNVTDQEISNSLQQTRQKVQDLEKEKKDVK